MKISKAYSYDDVLLVPQYSDIVPKDVNICSKLTNKIKLRVPIITSPMDTVTEAEMAIKMAQLGGAGFIHKNMTIDEMVINIKKVKNAEITEGATIGLDGKLFVGISISHSISDENLEKLISSGVDALVLDSAHGHSKNIVEKTKYIKNLYPHIQLIAGNVATRDGARALAIAGADAIRVGIGPGAICTTRIVTGVGVPQLSAVMNAADGVAGTKTKVIADGGLKTSGDMVKAFAAGAHAVIIGSMAAGATETPGERIFINDKAYKSYRGMGSIGAMKKGSADRYMQEGVDSPEKFVPEGVEGLVETKGNIDKLIFQYVGGIKSGLGYLGATKLEELRARAEFVEMSSSGLQESHPHSLSSFEKTTNYGGK